MFFHKLAHLFGINHGKVVSVTINPNDFSWLAFQCDICGDVSGLCAPYGADWSQELDEERKRNYIKIV